MRKKVRYREPPIPAQTTREIVAWIELNRYTVKQIAAKYSVSTQRVYQIRRRFFFEVWVRNDTPLAKEPVQKSLFVTVPYYLTRK